LRIRQSSLISSAALKQPERLLKIAAAHGAHGRLQRLSQFDGSTRTHAGLLRSEAAAPATRAPEWPAIDMADAELRHRVGERVNSRRQVAGA
jgi:hypothetical protein